ncbi:MAG TPA: LssY C-terminal domain-containing protein [Terriglobales bacterium]|nr:LssY C-terminal domain-containing protein [Terriglobales bacterium]
MLFRNRDVSRGLWFPAIFCLGVALSLVLPAFAQDSNFVVLTSQSWVDTGLDLQSGDLVQITAASSAGGCDPNGVSGAASAANLPLSTAPAGALIARLHAQGATPVLVGGSHDINITEASHLFLSANVSGDAPCQGKFAVKVHRVANGATAANGQSENRGQQLKAQLATAAEIFMQGQFGLGQPATGTSAASGAATLKLSTAPLDEALRHDIDGLPRRVNDQFKNLGDMVNFVIIGSQKDVQAALDAANWHVADTDNKNAVFEAAMDTFEQKDYLQMPMSTLYLFDRPQDFGYEMAEPIAMVASRNHFRIWKAPFAWQGHEVWVGAGTHDIGFAKDKRNGSVTHKIDPLVDGERDNIGGSLQKADKVKSLTYYLPPNPVQQAKNATGDGYSSDGRLLVIMLQ